MLSRNDAGQMDVIVAGGGIAGLATSIHLVRAGLRVLCIEADAENAAPVGESLDWSAPALLADLGLPMQMLIDGNFGTWKRHVTLQLANGSSAHYIPGQWLGRSPFNVELRTLHVDRVRLNAAVREIAVRDGVNLLYDRVTEVETQGRKVASVTTASGRQLVSPWFIDASGGSARLLPRAFHLPVSHYGPAKVAIWTYFAVSDAVEGATLHAEGSSSTYMDWVWEIPIHADCLSIGFVAPGESVKALRSRGLSIEEILRMQMNRFPRVRRLVDSTPEISACVTSYRCRVHSHIFGPNWLVVGESAATVDPMTSNGVTAALRHASEAASLIARYRYRDRLPWIPSALYSRRVQDLARFFNCGIEKVIYDARIRNRIGLMSAGDVYTIPAWSLNNLYSRFRRQGLVSSLFFCFLLGSLRAAASLLHSVCRPRRSPCEVAG